MKTIAKRIGIKVYNLKNGPFWKQGGAIVERQGHNMCWTVSRSDPMEKITE